MSRADNVSAILSAIAAWDDANVTRLSALVRLGSPTDMHSAAPDVPGEHDTDPGGARAVRRASDAEDHARASVLHAWREVSVLARVPLPAPGKPV
jgi:hypothetical protein